MKQKISDYLLTGENHAIPLSELERLSGLDGRTVRRLIQLERLDGAAICSDCCRGYYLAADDGERQRFVKSMYRRAAEIQKTAFAVERGDGRI